MEMNLDLAIIFAHKHLIIHSFFWALSLISKKLTPSSLCFRKLADICPLLDVEDMVMMKVPDWKCVFTQIQSYYRRFRNHEKNALRGQEPGQQAPNTEE